MKIIASLIIIITSTLFGIDISNKYRKRIIHLRLCIQSLQLLETEMEFSQPTIQEIFIKLSHHSLFPLSLFYERLNEILKTNIDDFFEIWSIEVDQLHKVTSLSNEDIEIFKQVGKYIGIYHLNQQKKQIQLSINYLENQLEEALEQYRKFGNMALILGLLIGILLVILFY